MTAEEIVEYLFADGITIKEAIEAITTYGLQKQNEVLDKAAEVATVERGYGDVDGACTVIYTVNKQSILNLKNKL